MQGRELIGYCRLHAESEVAQFSRSQLQDLIKMAKVKVELDPHQQWIQCRKEDIDYLCDEAEKNLKAAEETVKKFEAIAKAEQERIAEVTKLPEYKMEVTSVEVPGHVLDGSDEPVPTPELSPEMVKAVKCVIALSSGMSAFTKDLKVSDLAKAVVETEFPGRHYGDITWFEAWPMRSIMENLVEIALKVSQVEQYKQYAQYLEEKIQDYIDTSRNLQEGKEHLHLKHWDALVLAKVQGQRKVGLLPPYFSKEEEAELEKLMVEHDENAKIAVNNMESRNEKV